MSTEVHAVAQHAVLYALMRQQLLEELLRRHGVNLRAISVDDGSGQIRLGPLTGRARLVAQVTGREVRWAHHRKLSKRVGPEPLGPRIRGFGQEHGLEQLVGDGHPFPTPPGMDPNQVMTNVGHELGVVAVEVLGADVVYQVLPGKLARQDVYAVDQLSEPVRALELGDVITFFPRVMPMVTQLDHALGGLSALTGWTVGKGPDREGNKRTYEITDQQGARVLVDFTFDARGSVTHLHFDGVHPPAGEPTAETPPRAGHPQPGRESYGLVPAVRRVAQRGVLPVLLRQAVLQQALQEAGVAGDISVDERQETIWFGGQRARARLVGVVGEGMLMWAFAQQLQAQLGPEPLAHLVREYGTRHGLVEVSNEYFPWTVPEGRPVAEAINELAHDVGMFAVQALGHEYVYQALHTPSGAAQLVLLVDQLPFDVPALRLSDVVAHLPGVINHADNLDNSLAGLAEATGWRLEELAPGSPDKRRINLVDGDRWTSFELSFDGHGKVSHLHFEGNLQ